ncbi:MAG: methyltransferase, partial [Burkholderiaceae bacterium]
MPIDLPSPATAADAPALNAGSGALADLARRERFFDALARGLADGSVSRVLLSKPLVKEGDLERVWARPLTLRGQACLSIVYQHRTKDVTKNEPLAMALETIAALVGTRFAHAHLFAGAAGLQVLMPRMGRYALCRARADEPPAGEDAARPADDGAPATEADARHDRPKRRLLSLSAPFLTALGVTTERREL